jgi:hypothetical protein
MPIPLLAVLGGITAVANATKAGLELAGESAQKDKLAQMRSAPPITTNRSEGPSEQDLVAAIEENMEEAKQISLDVPEELA